MPLTLPARFCPDATKKPKGLKWEYQRHAHGLRDNVEISVGDHWRGAGDGESFAICSMTFVDSNDYDTYAYLMLCFVCDRCEAQIEPPDWFSDCDEEYCYYMARRAESAGWHIGFDDGMPCLCPDCGAKR